MIYTQKAAVLFNNVWQKTIGMVDGRTSDFIFLLNARMEKVPEGRWRIYPIDYDNNHLENDVIALNLNFLLTRTRFKSPTLSGVRARQ